MVILRLDLVTQGNKARPLLRKKGSDVAFPLQGKDLRGLVVVVLLVARGEEAEAKRRRESQRPSCRPSRPRPALLQRQARLPPRLRSRSQFHRLCVGRSPRAWLVSAGQVGPMRVVVLMTAWVAATSNPGARHVEQRQGVVGVEYLLARAALRDVDEGGDAAERVVCEIRPVFGGAGWRRKRTRAVRRQSLLLAGSCGN